MAATVFFSWQADTPNSVGRNFVRKALEDGYNWFMRILPAVEEEIRRVVRDARAKDPLIRVARSEAVLEKHFNRGFSHQHVSKIADKVAREGLMEADRTQIEQGMQFTRENYRMMREEFAQDRVLERR
jgi:hypothetical protein